MVCSPPHSKKIGEIGNSSRSAKSVQNSTFDIYVTQPNYLNPPYPDIWHISSLWYGLSVILQIYTHLGMCTMWVYRLEKRNQITYAIYTR